MTQGHRTFGCGDSCAASIDPADSPDCGCSGKCFLGGPVRADCDRRSASCPPWKSPGPSPDLSGCVDRAVLVEACSCEISVCIFNEQMQLSFLAPSAAPAIRLNLVRAPT